MKKVSLLFGMMCFLITGAMAQEKVKSVKHENVTWHRIVKIDYKAGKVGRAKEIIKMYEAAGEAAGNSGPQKYWYSTGGYDLMLIWTMDGGPSDMEWSRSPEGAKWRTEFIKLQGSEEKANQIQEEYASLISSSTNDLCRKKIE